MNGIKILVVKSKSYAIINPSSGFKIAFYSILQSNSIAQK